MASSPKFFDIHQHVGGLIGIPGVHIETASPAEDVARRLRVMDRLNIGRAALMPGHAYSAPAGIADTRALNDGLVAYQKLAPHRFPTIIGTVEPRHGDAALEELARLHALGFKGASWHHRMQGLPMDHPIMFAILAQMQKSRMIPLLHCYPQADFESLWRLQRLALSFPQLPFIVLDSMTDNEHFEAALAMGEVVPNVYFETASTAVGSAGIRVGVARLGAGRFLFGTNLYSMMDRQTTPEISAITEAGLDARQLELIAQGNAARLLQI